MVKRRYPVLQHLDDSSTSLAEFVIKIRPVTQHTEPIVESTRDGGGTDQGEIELVPLCPSEEPNNEPTQQQQIQKQVKSDGLRHICFPSKICILMVLCALLVCLAFFFGVFEKFRFHNGMIYEVAKKRTLIVLSIDAFGWQYLQRGLTPNIMQLDTSLRGSCGTLAKLIPVFPSKTLPNHYTIATGLYPESHGVIANHFYDPVLHESFNPGNNDPKWYGGQPIWNTAEAQGLVTASLFFPGSEVLVDGHRPSYVVPFRGDMSLDDRIKQILEWVNFPEDKRPSLITGYINVLDDVGHKNGPNSREVNNTLLAVDSAVGHLVKSIYSSSLHNEIDIIVLSDHGMAPIDNHRVIYLDDYIDPVLATIFYGDLALIYPQVGYEEAILSNLTFAKESHNLQFNIYTNQTIPESYHYRTSVNPRIPPILVVADVGWELTDHTSMDRHPEYFNGGDHGYNNTLDSMAALFAACGPSFIRTKAEDKPITIQNIDMYNLMANVLGITPASNNGTAGTLNYLLNIKGKSAVIP